MIKVVSLNKYFNKKKQNEIHVINNITLDFPQTGLVVLLGASGSGKTTLLNVIGGLDKVESGTIKFNEDIIRKYNANTWDAIRTKNIGYVFQNYNLLKDLSVYDNIAFVLQMIGINDKDEIEKRVNYILRSVNMYKFRKRKASQLSGGQQQRVAIARALVKNPQIIIADEPTGNLDSENTLEIMNILKVISKEKLVVLVTHEKELANVYADRIIEIKDGQIEKDEIVLQNSEHNFKNENVIYLKDLTKILNQQKNDNINYSVYVDDENDLQELNVKLILKNKTWYLDINSNINKVKLLSDNVGVTIKDEHFKTKTKEELTSTKFDLSYLNNDNVAKHKKSTISLKKSFRMAIQKVASFTKKAKLILFALFLSGILMAFASSSFFSAFNVSTYDFMSLQKNYITLSESNYNYYETEPQAEFQAEIQTLPSYDELTTIFGNNYHVQARTNQNPIQFWTNDEHTNYMFIFQQFYNRGLSISSNYDFAETLGESQLTSGRLPENDYEFVIDKKTADNLLEQAKTYGIWEYENLLKLNARIKLTNNSNNYKELKLVGIVDNFVDAIYVTKPMYYLLNNSSYNHFYVDIEYNNLNNVATTYSINLTYKLPLELLSAEDSLENINLVAGTIPTTNTNEILISSNKLGSMLNSVNDFSQVAFPFSVTWKDKYDNEVEIKISGVFNNSDIADCMVAPSKNLERLDYELTQHENQSSYVQVFTQNPKTAIEKLTELNINHSWNFTNAEKSRQTQVIANVTATIVGVLVLLALNALGFYFIIRSSMMNRIYEISVYRALGVKKADIKKMFLLELLFLTTITSLVGYVLGTMLAGQVQSLFSSFNMSHSFFVVNFISVSAGFGLLYIISILFGMFPVNMLLKKTPSEILSKYDI